MIEREGTTKYSQQVQYKHEVGLSISHSNYWPY